MCCDQVKRALLGKHGFASCHAVPSEYNFYICPVQAAEVLRGLKGAGYDASVRLSGVNYVFAFPSAK